MKLDRVDGMNRGMHALADSLGSLLVDAFHYIGLFAIGSAIVWSAGVAFLGMAAKGHASIHDILLLFIYLELGAMVGIYFKTNHMPVRFLIYVAMTALTRLLIFYVQEHERPDIGIVMASGAILLLAFGALVIRFGSFRFPSYPADSKDGAA
jgi:phosphate starvation-inducible membrane PsiE